MSSKDNMKNSFEVRNDADLQAIQTSVAFKNISDAIEQYRRQFGLAFLALIAFSAIHVGLVVIANLYTMETRVSGGVLSSTSDPDSKPVGVSMSSQHYDLGYIMSNMDETSQIDALNNMKSTNFVDRDGNYRQYTVTGFQLGGWKRSELKLYTSVGHILEYVRGKGLKVHHDHESLCNCSGDSRKLLTAPPSPPPAYPPNPAPPPPFAPGYTMTTYGHDDDVNLTAMLEASALNTQGLQWTVGNSTAATDNIYSQDWVKTIAHAAGVSGATSSITSASKLTVLGNKTANLMPLKSYRQSEFDKEKNAWKDMSAANQEAVLDKGFDIGIAMAVEVAKKAHDNVTFDLSSWLASEYSVTSITQAQANETAAQFAANGIVAEAKSKAKISGQNFWDKIEKGANEEAAFKVAGQCTYEYQCLNGENSCTNGGDANICTSGNGNAAIIAYWNNIKTEAIAANNTFVSQYGSYNATAVAIEAAANVTSWYASQISYHNGATNYHANVMDNIVVEVAANVVKVASVYSNYKNDGYIKWTTSGTSASRVYTPDTGDYGCTNKTVTELQVDSDGPLVGVLTACLKKSSSGEYTDPYTAGAFFSRSIGYFERFSLYTPPSVCEALDGISSDSTISNTIAAYRTALGDTSGTNWGDSYGVETEYVYMLHGWGGDDSFLHMMSHTLAYVFDVRSGGHHYGAVDGFLVMAPADGSTPYAHKTWYFNNDFTGFHLDMIVFELRTFIGDSLGVQQRAQGAFGFSMGGWGSIHIAMTYPDQFQALASFNAPMKPNGCHFANICHVECGVDFFMCEMLWTSIGVAAAAYVVVVADQVMDSTGAYSPMALGNLANIMGDNLIYGGFMASAADKTKQGAVGDNFYGQQIRCVWGLSGSYIAPASMTTMTLAYSGTKMTGSGLASYTMKTGKAIAHFRSVGYTMMDSVWNTGLTADICAGTGSGYRSCAMTSVLTWIYEEVAWASKMDSTHSDYDSYFYLDPVIYTMTSQFFSPTHNNLSGAAQRGSSRDGAYYKMLGIMPYNRLMAHSGAFSHFPIYILISCDPNDQNGAGPDTDAYVAILYKFKRVTTNVNAGTGWVYDRFENRGHSFSQRDIRLAIQWMSDAFRTFTGLGDLRPADKGSQDAYYDKYQKSFYDLLKDMAIGSTDTVGACYLEMEWKTYMGAYNPSSQTWTQSGGYFDHDTACKTSIWTSQSTTTWSSSARHLSATAVSYYHPGVPQGVFEDQLDAKKYAKDAHEHMEAGPSASAMHDMVTKIQNSGAYGTGTGTEDINFGQMTCWPVVESGDTFTSGGTSYTTNQANCCAGSTKTTDCTTHLENVYYLMITDCCKTSTFSAILDSAEAGYYGSMYEDAWDTSEYPDDDYCPGCGSDGFWGSSSTK